MPLPVREPSSFSWFPYSYQEIRFEHIDTATVQFALRWTRRSMEGNILGSARAGAAGKLFARFTRASWDMLLVSVKSL